MHLNAFEKFGLFRMTNNTSAPYVINLRIGHEHVEVHRIEVTIIDNKPPEHIIPALCFVTPKINRLKSVGDRAKVTCYLDTGQEILSTSSRKIISNHDLKYRVI